MSSHLAKVDTMDILLWLKVNRNMLAVSAKHPVRRVVAWKEIFPTKRNNHNGQDPDSNKKER